MNKIWLHFVDYCPPKLFKHRPIWSHSLTYTLTIGCGRGWLQSQGFRSDGCNPDNGVRNHFRGNCRLFVQPHLHGKNVLVLPCFTYLPCCNYLHVVPTYRVVLTSQLCITTMLYLPISLYLHTM